MSNLPGVDQATMKRFWAKVGPRDIYGCFPWIGAVDSSGYGSFRDSLGVRINTHRFALMIKLGRPIKKRHLACHKCPIPPPGKPNKLCCNPEHLYEGTFSSNQADSYAFGERELPPQTTARGEKRKESKLKEFQVLEIYNDRHSTPTQLAKKYGVSPRTIYKIIKRETWSYLTEKLPDHPFMIELKKVDS